MNIAIDIDGVLTDLEKYMKEKGRVYFQKEIVDETGYDLDIIFGVSKEEKDRFWNENYFKYIESYPLREEASKVTHRLHELGHKVIIITARKFNPGYGYESEEEFKKATENSLRNRGIYFDEIYFVPSPKVKEAKELCIDLFLEDDIRNIVPLSKVTKVAIIDSSYNRTLDLPNTYRVKTLDEIENILDDLN